MVVYHAARGLFDEMLARAKRRDRGLVGKLRDVTQAVMRTIRFNTPSAEVAIGVGLFLLLYLQALVHSMAEAVATCPGTAQAGGNCGSSQDVAMRAVTAANVEALMYLAAAVLVAIIIDKVVIRALLKSNDTDLLPHDNSPMSQLLTVRTLLAWVLNLRLVKGILMAWLLTYAFCTVYSRVHLFDSAQQETPEERTRRVTRHVFWFNLAILGVLVAAGWDPPPAAMPNQ